MLIDLTVNVPSTSPLLAWARSKDKPHIAMGHVGTHLDTYKKSRIPLEYFRSRAVLFDVRGREETGLEDVDVSRVEKGDFIIFRTGRMESTGYGDPGYFENHPMLSKELILSLLEKGVHFIGIDATGIRRGEEHEWADRLAEDNGAYVIENLSNLEKLERTDFTVYTMWLEDPEMTGLKCRVIAET